MFLLPSHSVRAPAQESSAYRSVRGWLLAVAFLLITHASFAAPLATQEQALAERLVGDRGQQRNSRRMVLDPVLTAVARARAEDMAKRRYFSHTDPDGNGPNSLARSAGYPLPSSYVRSRSQNFIESISAGQATAEAAWEAWMRSPTHRTHLLAQSSFYRDQTNFGVGFYSDPASPYRNYWVVLTAPPLHSTNLTTGRGTKAVRISVAAPAWSEDDADGTPAAPRPSVAPMPNAAGKIWNWEEGAQTQGAAPGKLWNWEDSGAAPRPVAPRPRRAS